MSSCRPNRLRKPSILCWRRPLWNAAQAADQREILRAGQVGVEHRLFGDVADARLVGEEIVSDRTSVEQRAAGRLEQPGEDRHRRRLPGPVRPEQAQDAPRRQLEAESRTAGIAE